MRRRLGCGETPNERNAQRAAFSPFVVLFTVDLTTPDPPAGVCTSAAVELTSVVVELTSTVVLVEFRSTVEVVLSTVTVVVVELTEEPEPAPPFPFPLSFEVVLFLFLAAAIPTFVVDFPLAFLPPL